MKKTLLSVIISIGFTGSLYAQDLTTIYQQALDKDPVVNRAKALRDVSLEGVTLARAPLLPQVSGSIGYSMSDTNDVDTDTLNYRVGLSMSLYDHAKWVGMDRAEKVAQQAEASYSATLQDLIVRVVDAYLNILRAKDNVEFVQAEKRAIERQLEQTKQRFEVGLIAITDVHEAQANFDTTIAQEIRAQNTLELRKEQLREITGLYYQEVNVLNTETFAAQAPAPQNVEEWLDLAQMNNLDLQAQQFAVDIAKDDISANQASHLPTLGLSGSMSRSDFDTNGIERYYHGDTDGYVYVHNSGDNFDGSSIDARYQTPDYDYGDFGTLKTLHYVKLSIGPENEVQPSLRVRFDYDSNETPQPEDYLLDSVPAPSIFGTALFGTAKFGASEQPLVRLALQGSGYSNSFRIVTNDTNAPYTINGLYIDYIPSGRR